MARSDGTDEEIWSTREELLLACAVSRHGTQSWESVAAEVRSRSSSSHLLTAQTCKRRYNDLQRRFAADPRGIDAPDSAAVSLLEVLRRLRVAELRREVERYDVSIVSLQSKVKRLKEDRERNLPEPQSGDKSDLPELDGAEKENVSPGNLADGCNYGESRRSCNESNSIEPKQGQSPRAVEEGVPEETARDGGARADPVPRNDDKLAGEGSYNGSSETVAKGGNAESATPAEEPANPSRMPDGGESGESVAESKGEASGESSSDVQSSASPSRRRRGRRKAPSGASSSADEADADAVSPSSKEDATQSQPLASFLRTIRSRRHGSVFERRLESQESAPYRSLIRQHVDLGVVQGKMDEGAYVSDAEFYRDLLLIGTNAVVFYPRTSEEHAAGAWLRGAVRKQMGTTIRKPGRSPPPAAAVESAAPPLSPPSAGDRQPVATRAKVEEDIPGSLLEKPIPAAPLVACRKRSSIAGKAAVKVPAAAKVEEKTDMDKEEVESGAERRGTKERSAVVRKRGLRTSKTRGGHSGPIEAVGKNTESATAADVATTKTVRKNMAGNAAAAAAAAANSVAKKRSAVNFLSRMNRAGASNNGSLLETLKSSGVGGRQRRGGRVEGRREQGPKQGTVAGGSSSKHAQDHSPPVKRSVGRPPKRPPPPLPSPPAKRGREVDPGLPPPTKSTVAKKRGRR